MTGLACDVQTRSTCPHDAIEVIAAAGLLLGTGLVRGSSSAAGGCGGGCRARGGREFDLVPAGTAVTARQIRAVGTDGDHVSAPAAPHIQQRPLCLRRVVGARPVMPGIGGSQNDFVM